MKRNYLFYWFAVLLLLFSPARSYAEVYSGTCGENVNWTLDTETGLLEISGNGEMEDFTINPTWSNYRTKIKECIIKDGVINISNNAFKRCTNLISISIGNTVKRIGQNAFINCNAITEIHIPKNVITIEDNAFIGCRSLISITFEDGSESLALGYNTTESSGLFSYCPLENLYLGRKIISKIGAFSNNTTLTIVHLGNQITSIGNSAFYGCTGLTSITIPESVTSIGSYAFGHCI